MNAELVGNKSINLVFVTNGKPATDSRRIADTFQKTHDKVLRDIRTLLTKAPEEFAFSNFGETSYKNKQGREMPMYIVTFDGFAMLAMGYTGEKAIEFKVRYINEFNRTRQLVESHQETLKSHEQKQIQQQIKQTIYSQYPEISAQARMKYFTCLHKDLKDRYRVTSFRDILRKDFLGAIEFINKWDSPRLESRRRLT
ncbi:Rha family transcriptional regulator [Alkalihalobacillus sp. LMS39]|uniref:Rha family transcriptional regulator n=1 Tax=Alkalihalobacillus sp. LMS39 TaxID=2924032 RepID=UPI001FB2B94F|nr:Rha family transcriptional regulator [Alkalihalobacillus sp. LMS39]UOE96054.1 Rha family transcriptional regulator [Alkalihalobacillus sp. LMS39]